MKQPFIYFPSTTQTAAYTGTSASITNAVGAFTNVVRLISTTDCYVRFDSSPTATTSDMYLKASTPEYFRIHPGQKVAAVQVATGGNLTVTEMTQ